MSWLLERLVPPEHLVQHDEVPAEDERLRGQLQALLGDELLAGHRQHGVETLRAGAQQDADSEHRERRRILQKVARVAQKYGARRQEKDREKEGVEVPEA